jgi:AcrR family transcriptional regulator
VPKVVDRSARRSEIVDAYLAIVARDGAAAATSRSVAAELGAATGALWHYFSDFDEMLLAAFERVYENTTRRISAAVGDSRGVAALEASLHEMLPLDAETQSEATVVVAFWGRVANFPELGQVLSQVEAEWRAMLLGQIADGVERGEFRADIPAEDVADTLLALTTAVQIEHVVRTPLGKPVSQWRLVQHALSPWRIASGG